MTNCLQGFCLRQSMPPTFRKKAKQALKGAFACAGVKTPKSEGGLSLRRSMTPNPLKKGALARSLIKKLKALLKLILLSCAVLPFQGGGHLVRQPCSTAHSTPVIANEVKQPPNVSTAACSKPSPNVATVANLYSLAACIIVGDCHGQSPRNDVRFARILLMR